MFRILPYAVRAYRCPLCGHEEQHGTNHRGEIYCNCRVCASSPLYCAEVDANEGCPFITATLRAYRFNLEFLDAKAAYLALCALLGALGFKKVEVHERHATIAAEQAHDGETVKLFDPEQFDGQYVSSIGRLYNWKQAIVPNRYIKTGYWLEFSDQVDRAQSGRDVSEDKETR